MTLNYRILLFCLTMSYILVDVIPRRLVWVDASQAFLWYDNDKDLTTYFFATHLRCVFMLQDLESFPSHLWNKTSPHFFNQQQQDEPQR